jgi:hypothetical protein
VFLTLTDFFVFGLRIEIVGAWLVARGLLAPLLLLKSFGTYGGIGAADVISGCSDSGYGRRPTSFNEDFGGLADPLC